MKRSCLRNIYLKNLSDNVNIINRETIAHLFYEKQKLTIMQA